MRVTTVAKFGNTSLEKLSTCDKRLQALFEIVVQEYDCTILEGHRSIERQAQLYASGKSRVKLSKHNTDPSLAVDVAPFPVDWNDKERFISFGSYVKGLAYGMGVKIRWGGDWDGDWDMHDQTFNDLVHFELIIEENE